MGIGVSNVSTDDLTNYKYYIILSGISFTYLTLKNLYLQKELAKKNELLDSKEERINHLNRQVNENTTKITQLQQNIGFNTVTGLDLLKK
jgi:cell division protein FtsL